MTRPWAGMLLGVGLAGAARADDAAPAYLVVEAGRRARLTVAFDAALATELVVAEIRGVDQQLRFTNATDSGLNALQQTGRPGRYVIEPAPTCRVFSVVSNHLTADETQWLPSAVHVAGRDVGFDDGVDGDFDDATLVVSGASVHGVWPDGACPAQGI